MAEIQLISAKYLIFFSNRNLMADKGKSLWQILRILWQILWQKRQNPLNIKGF